jgi:3-oxoacyl-[acyl-carrier protein] reductase
MDLGLSGRVALVAGGSSGLGLAIAGELAREGADVVIGARDPTRLAAAEATLQAVATGRVVATRLDVEDAASLEPWIDGCAQRMGRLDILVTNSAGPPPGHATAFSVDDYRAAVDQILYPAIGLALAALPHMKAARWGRVLFIASETVHRPVTHLTLSGVARSGIVRFAEALVGDLGASGITVNVLAPAYLRTGPVDRIAAELVARHGGDVESQVRAMAEHIPLGRVGDPRELAAVAAFLASERASFVTGTVQLIDGGASAVGAQAKHHALLSKTVFV